MWLVRTVMSDLVILSARTVLMMTWATQPIRIPLVLVSVSVAIRRDTMVKKKKKLCRVCSLNYNCNNALIMSPISLIGPLETEVEDRFCVFEGRSIICRLRDCGLRDEVNWDWIVWYCFARTQVRVSLRAQQVFS